MFSCLFQLPFLLRTNLTAKPTNSIAKPTNSIANGTNSIAKPTNSIANGTNSIANGTNSIAKATKSIANGTNSIAKSPNSIAKTCNNFSTNQAAIIITDFKHIKQILYSSQCISATQHFEIATLCITVIKYLMKCTCMHSSGHEKQ